MQNLSFTLQIGSKLPQEIINDYHGNFYVALFDNNFYIFVKNYQSKKDIEAWKHGNFQFHISNIHSLLFFVFYLPEIEFIFDVPYDIHRTGMTQEQAREGIRAVHLFLVDDSYILRAYRGIELSIDTREKIGEMLENQWKEIQDPMLFDSLLNLSYSEYETSEAMFTAPAMIIQWEKKSEIKA